jgi:hypothetical protein
MKRGQAHRSKLAEILAWDGFNIAYMEFRSSAVESSRQGPKVATILSVVESCRRLKRSVRWYLAVVLPGLADVVIQRLPELTPVAWANQYPA